MDTRDTLLADFDHEMAVTRQLIARIPEAALDWRPHDKSFSVGELATHLATLPRWGAQILSQPGHDLLSGKGRRPRLPSLVEVLEDFDRHAAEVRQCLLDRPSAGLAETWSLKNGRETLMTLPKHAALRRFLLHHVIHHRGQLSVYLRLLNVPLPPIYGPSADEHL